MESYLCHHCSVAKGHLQSVATGSILATTYQLGKYLKHSLPDPRYNVQSVFDSISTQQYTSYIVSSALSGSVQFDDQGRTNIIWVAGNPTGFEFRSGVLIQPQDAVKVVLSADTAKIHAFPQASTTFSAQKCSSCGATAIA